MPIPIDQFEKGLGADQIKIIELLDSNPDKAYSLTELAISVGKTKADTSALERISEHILLMDQITYLISKGLIRFKKVGNEIYYAVIPKSKGIKP